ISSQRPPARTQIGSRTASSCPAPTTLNNRRSYACPPFLHGAAGRCPPDEAHSLVADFSTSTSTLSRTLPPDPQAWGAMPGYLLVRNLGGSGTKSAPPPRTELALDPLVLLTEQALHCDPSWAARGTVCTARTDARSTAPILATWPAGLPESTGIVAHD